MTDASKRRADDAGFEFESDWEVGSNLMECLGGIEDLAVKAMLPAGVTSMTMWGKTKFAFGKYEKEKANYQTVFDKDTNYKGGPNSVSKNHISFRCKKRTPKLASCTFLS